MDSGLLALLGPGMTVLSVSARPTPGRKSILVPQARLRHADVCLFFDTVTKARDKIGRFPWGRRTAIMQFSIYSELQTWPGKTQQQVYAEALEQVVNADRLGYSTYS